MVRTVATTILHQVQEPAVRHVQRWWRKAKSKTESELLHIVLPTAAQAEQKTSAGLVTSPPLVTEEMLDLFDRYGVSTEYLQLRKQEEIQVMTPSPNTPGQRLPQQDAQWLRSRAFAAHWMIETCRQKNIKSNCWHSAVMLLDAYSMKTGFGPQMLPAVSMCLVRLVNKYDRSAFIPDHCGYLPYAQELSRNFAKQGVPNMTTITDQLLRETEMHILRVLDWNLDIPTVDQWLTMYTTRFNIISKFVYEKHISMVEQQSMHFVGELIKGEALTLQLPARELALGLFCYGLVSVGLLTVDRLQPTEAPGRGSAVNAGNCALSEAQLDEILSILEVSADSKLEAIQRAYGSAALRFNQVCQMFAELQRLQAQQAERASMSPPAAVVRAHHDV
mmetsp:Transcript_20284/g.36205  ORF Transcript_20284/g.36205 Transcript_20284/m.36205 type:complete len:390 (+) Transcript_20284:58-1227(+)